MPVKLWMTAGNSLWQILLPFALHRGLDCCLCFEDLRDSRNCSCNMNQYNLQNLWCSCFYNLEVRCLETYHLVKTPLTNSLDHVQAVPTKEWGYSTVLAAFYSSESISQWPMSQFTLVLFKWGDADALNESQVIMNKQSCCAGLPSGAVEMHWNSSCWKGPV